MGFLDGASGKNPPASARDARDADLITGLGRSPEGGTHSRATHSSIVAWKNPMDRGAWAVHSLTKNQVQLKSLCTHACMYITVQHKRVSLNISYEP